MKSLAITAALLLAAAPVGASTIDPNDYNLSTTWGFKSSEGIADRANYFLPTSGGGIFVTEDNNGRVGLTTVDLDLANLEPQSFWIANWALLDSEGRQQHFDGHVGNNDFYGAHCDLTITGIRYLDANFQHTAGMAWNEENRFDWTGGDVCSTDGNVVVTMVAPMPVSGAAAFMLTGLAAFGFSRKLKAKS